MSNDYAAAALDYARQVIHGKQVACKWTRLACDRHVRDLERSRRSEFEFVFDPAAAARVCEFVESLPHPKGEWAARGELLKLEGWQVFNLASIFGWCERDDPARRRFHEAYISVARKNAKSTLAAGIAIYKFAADGERGAEVYFGAPSREQAMDVGFTPALAMIEGSPELCEAFGLKAHKKSVAKPNDRTAIMKTIIGKPGDGASPSCAIIDEYHEHADAVQYNAMKTGMGARRNPLLLVITTAGTDLASPCRALQDNIENILEGTVENERTFGNVYTLDEGDDWTAEQCLRKANPNFGVSVYPAYLRSQIADAVNSPRQQVIAKIKHANIWVNSATPWITPEDWKACTDPELTLDDFAGQECYIGLDLADRIDLAAKVICFPRLVEDKQHFWLFSRCYLNEDRVRRRANQHYAAWVAAGRLVATPGNVTSYPVIADELVEDAQRFIVREVPHDPHHAGPLVQFVQSRGDWNQHSEMVAIQANAGNFSPAMKEFEAAVLERRIHHDGDPVLAWAVSNVICKSFGRDLIMPNKKRIEQKIDPAVAALMAFMRACAQPPNAGEPLVEVY